MKALYRLPVKNIVGMGDSCPDTNTHSYVRELKTVETPEQLIAHITRWLDVWQLDRELFPDVQPLPTEGDILSGAWKDKVEEVLECISINRIDGCKHITAGEDCVSAQILLPFPFLTVMELGAKFGTPMSAIFEQRYGDGSGF